MNTRLTHSVAAELLQYFANLFVMAPLVITDKRNRCNPIDVAQERMLEYKLFETVVAVGRAKLFQTISRAVKVLDCYFLLEYRNGPYSFW